MEEYQVSNTIEALEEKITRKELFATVKNLLKLVEGQGQIIVEYCGFDEQDQEVVSLGLINIGRAIFTNIEIKCDSKGLVTAYTPG